MSFSTITLSELDEELRISISRCGEENESISIEAFVVREMDRGSPSRV